MEREEVNMSSNLQTMIVTGYFKGINEREIDTTFTKLFSSTFVWHGNIDQGLDSYKNDVKELIASFPDAKWNIDEIITEDDKVVVRWHFIGTHANTYGRISASGKQITYGGITIFRLRENKIVEAWNTENLLSLYRQIGVRITIPGRKKWWVK